MAEHKDIQMDGIHIPHAYKVSTYADLAGLTVSAFDVDKLGLVADTGAYYRLKSASPIEWVKVADTPAEVIAMLATKSDTTHNHGLAGLTEKSYNSLTDKPDLDLKVDKVSGYALSKNDFTDALKTLLETKKVKNVTTDAVNARLVITYTDDTTSNLNINDIVTDVNVTGATLDATTNVLTLTSSNGGADVTVNLSDFVNSSELASVLSGKQDKLISGDNIKSINGVSLLGSGNIVVGVDTSTERLIDCYRRDFKKSMLLQRNGLI